MQSSAIFDDAATEKGGETFLTETKPEDIAEQSFSGETSIPVATDSSVKASRVAFQGYVFYATDFV